MVQAALVMPFLLTIVFASLRLLMICTKSLRFQYDVAQVTREAFTKSLADRGNVDWQQYIETNLTTRAKAAGMSSALESESTFKSGIKPTFVMAATATPVTVTDWSGATQASRGDVFLATATSTEEILPSSWPGLNSLKVTLKAQGVAFVQMASNE